MLPCAVCLAYFNCSCSGSVPLNLVWAPSERSSSTAVLTFSDKYQANTRDVKIRKPNALGTLISKFRISALRFLRNAAVLRSSSSSCLSLLVSYPLCPNSLLASCLCRTGGVSSVMKIQRAPARSVVLNAERQQNSPLFLFFGACDLLVIQGERKTNTQGTIERRQEQRSREN